MQPILRFHAIPPAARPCGASSLCARLQLNRLLTTVVRGKSRSKQWRLLMAGATNKRKFRCPSPHPNSSHSFIRSGGDGR